MKPYHTIPIFDCGEPLVPIPLEHFAVVRPHPYQRLGAPYGDKSPYFLRQGVVAALLQAQQYLQAHHPGWRLQIFDAFRPIAVQRFMVEHTLADLARSHRLDPTALTAAQQEALMVEVLQFWAWPSDDPATPPPHSTGAAIDLTLVDSDGQPVAMGSAIDDVSPRSFPDHFQAYGEGPEQAYHRHRQYLYQAMAAAGFCRHPKEWWHFSLGDQLWAWVQRQVTGQSMVAHYGGAIVDEALYRWQCNAKSGSIHLQWLKLSH
ncbi:M15 family metallopeptidase [Nodosilinea sp. P-1105]|uniref:M15 family metallopeptidase n=1 Tax=Nodosilinea sp. P-1105 TaxID=2546229 RepID=UPI00146F5CB7|nr:M15 family metallopeptidase [Nodosilinea sp. P-1105]NMF82125.1 D-alanyl-D-alanine dipeptidase [Nodosilinea sp. P-1105]